MPTTTAKKIIKKAFQKAGILTKTQEPTADEANDALDALNDMLASWSNDTMMCYVRAWEFFPLNGGIGTYTMGTGGDFNTLRPVSIIDAYVRQGNATDTQISIINEILFNNIQQKDIPGLPQWLNNDGGQPLTKIRLNPVPFGGLQLFILSEKMLTQFALNDNVDLPPGWNRALIYNLADEICSDYGQEMPASAAKIAITSKSLIAKSIQKNRNFDAYPQNTNVNNIFTGWNR